MAQATASAVAVDIIFTIACLLFTPQRYQNLTTETTTEVIVSVCFIVYGKVESSGLPINDKFSNVGRMCEIFEG